VTAIIPIRNESAETEKTVVMEKMVAMGKMVRGDRKETKETKETDAVRTTRPIVQVGMTAVEKGLHT
jgi:hypothetical protein